MHSLCCEMVSLGAGNRVGMVLCVDSDDVTNVMKTGVNGGVNDAMNDVMNNSVINGI